MTMTTRSCPEMVGDMLHVTLNSDLSKIPFVHCPITDNGVQSTLSTLILSLSKIWLNQYSSFDCHAIPRCLEYKQWCAMWPIMWKRDVIHKPEVNWCIALPAEDRAMATCNRHEKLVKFDRVFFPGHPCDQNTDMHSTLCQDRHRNSCI